MAQPALPIAFAICGAPSRIRSAVKSAAPARPSNQTVIWILPGAFMMFDSNSGAHEKMRLWESNFARPIPTFNAVERLEQVALFAPQAQGQRRRCQAATQLQEVGSSFGVSASPQPRKASTK